MHYTEEFHNTITATQRRELAKKIERLKMSRENCATNAMRSLNVQMFEFYEAKASRISENIWALEAELEELTK